MGMDNCKIFFCVPLLCLHYGRQAGSFNTVEGFWKNYVHLKRPSSISTNVNVYLFRDEKGHVPMWEVSSRKLDCLDSPSPTHTQSNMSVCYVCQSKRHTLETTCLFLSRNKKGEQAESQMLNYFERCAGPYRAHSGDVFGSFQRLGGRAAHRVRVMMPYAVILLSAFPVSGWAGRFERAGNDCSVG